MERLVKVSNEANVFDKLMNYSSSQTKGEVSERIKEKKAMKPTERLIANIVDEKFNMDQLEDILKEKNDMLIISCAGSGKTTSLNFKVIYDVLSGDATREVGVNGRSVRVPEKIWVGTFLKTGAEELKNSMKKWIRQFGITDFSESVQFSTMHAEFRRALVNLGVKPDIISSRDNTALLKKVCNGYAIRNEKGNNLNAEDLSNLETALSYTRNRLDEKRYENRVYEDFRMNAGLIDWILRDWKAERVAKNCMDFEDLQEFLYEECYVKENEKVINYLASRFNFIYLDEFQDTSQIQYALIKVYASHCKKIVAIGDDDQTIYSWRGSDNKIICEDFREDFSPVVKELSVNYRCPEGILDAIIPSIQKNTQRYEKSLKAFKSGGELKVGYFPNYRTMCNSLYEEVRKDVVAGKKVTVLCRTNSDGLAPALLFDLKGDIKFSISGKDMTLNSYIGRLCVGMIRLFTEKSSADVKRALEALTWETYEVGTLMKACKQRNMSFWQLPERDIAYSCPSIVDILLAWKKVRGTSGEIECLKFILKYYRDMVFVKQTQFNTTTKAVIDSLLVILESVKYSSVDDFLWEIEEIDDRLQAKLGNYVKGARVRIATVHEYKGKEADSVYVWNDSAGNFPYTKNGEIDKDELEEERRVHYIACTRAKEKMTIMAQESGGQFLAEMDLSGAGKVEQIKELKGSLRKGLGSASSAFEEVSMEELEQMGMIVESQEFTTGDEVPDELPEERWQQMMENEYLEFENFE